MEVTYKNIERLDSLQMVKLLKLLIKLEALKCGIPLRSATVPLNINTSDDGEDARIEWKELDGNNWWSKSDYIKAPLVIFQSKATDMNIEACKLEVSAEIKHTKRNSKKYNLTKKLKKSVEDVINNGGSYILFVNRSYTTGIKKRIDKIKEAFKDIKNKNYRVINIDVYDANRIADWVNEYFQAISYVYDCTVGVKIPEGFKTWDKLSQFDEFQKEYVRNPFIEERINILLNTASLSREVIRLTGFSGLGKTRLILEAFRPETTDTIEKQIVKSSIIYYDAKFSSSTMPGFVSQLIDNKIVGTLIIDNCEYALHQSLQAEVKRRDSKLNLITVDFEYERFSSTEGFNSIALQPDDLETIIPEIIKKLFPSLNDSEVGRIKESVRGFPYLAVLLSEQFSAGSVSIGLVDNKQLINKLIWGRESVNIEELEILTAIALFDKLGFDEELKQQMDFVACEKRFCSISGNEEECKKKFYAVGKKYLQKGVLQQRGRYIYIRAKPLAITLASNWWMTVQPEILNSLLEQVKTAGLATALCDQLRYLNFLKEARNIVERLCGPQAPFGNAEVLNTELGSRLFRSLVEVNPEATTEALVRIFGNMNKEELIKIDKGRRNLVWALEKIVWRKDTFEDGMKLLLSLAVAENEKWSNNSIGVFLQRFHVHLPATEANLNQRYLIIEFAYAKNDDYKILAIKALNSALRTHYFTRDVGSEFQGSSKPLKDYNPPFSERNEYWSNCLKLLVKIIKSNNKLSDEASSIISKSIRGLIVHGMSDIIIPIVENISKFKNNNWSEARNDLLQTLNFEKNTLPEIIKNELKRIIANLTPSDVVEKYKIYVMNPSLSEDIDEEGSYRDKSAKMSKNIAVEFAVQFDLLICSCAIIFNDNQQNGFYFGEELGNTLKNEERIVFLNKSIEYIKGNEKKLNLVVLTGFLNGIQDKQFVKNTIVQFINDDILYRYAFDLISAYLDEEIFEQLIELSITKFENIKVLLNLRYNRGIDLLNSEVIKEKLQQISEISNMGAWVALSIYYNILFSDKDKWDIYKENVRNIFMKENIFQSDVYVDMMELYLRDLIVKILKENDIEFAKHITKEIVKYCHNEDFYNRGILDIYLQAVLKHLISAYFPQIWPELSEGIISDSVTYHNLMHMIGSKIDFNDNLLADVRDKLDDDNGILFKGIQVMILQWCRSNLPLAPRRLARYLPTFANRQRVSWHPFTLTFIEEFGSDELVLNAISANLGSYSWVGSTVPLLEGQKLLFEQLKNHKIKIVKVWARRNIGYLDEEIKKEKIDDEEMYL